MPREAQRSGAWIEQACHALGCDAGGSPPADLRPERLATEFLCNPRGSPHVLCTTMYVCMYVEFQQEIHFKTSVSQQAELCLYVCTTRQVSHKENSDQGASPQPKLRPRSRPTSRITTRQGAGWLAGWLAELRPGNLSCTGWLAGWLGGWQAGCLRPKEPQGGPEKPTEAERG